MLEKDDGNMASKTTTFKRTFSSPQCFQCSNEKFDLVDHLKKQEAALNESS